jgi:hypothetical protein
VHDHPLPPGLKRGESAGSQLPPRQVTPAAITMGGSSPIHVRTPRFWPSAGLVGLGNVNEAV